MSTKAGWSLPFSVLNVTREDLCTTGLPRWQAASFKEEEMQQIAALIKQSYDNEYFLVRAKAAALRVLQQRTGTNIIGDRV